MFRRPGVLAGMQSPGAMRQPQPMPFPTPGAPGGMPPGPMAGGAGGPMPGGQPPVGAPPPGPPTFEAPMNPAAFQRQILIRELLGGDDSLPPGFNVPKSGAPIGTPGSRAR